MKRLAVILLAFFITLTASIYSLLNLKTVTENTAFYLENSKSKEDVYKTLEYWEKEKKKIGIFVNDDSVDKVTDSIYNCYSDFENYETERQKTLLTLEELYNSELPTIYNVF